MASRVIWKQRGWCGDWWTRSAGPWRVMILLFIAGWLMVSSFDPNQVRAADELELLELLQRAESLFREERPELAVPLLRKVIDEARDVVVPVAERKIEVEAKDEAKAKAPSKAEEKPLADGSADTAPPSVSPERERLPRWRYDEALRGRVWAVLQAAGAAGRRAYQIQVDGDARALLAAEARAENNVERESLVQRATRNALAELVQRYRGSSLAPAAAWEISSRALDEEDYVTAALMLDLLQELGLPDDEAATRAAWARRRCVVRARLANLSAQPAALWPAEAAKRRAAVADDKSLEAEYALAQQPLDESEQQTLRRYLLDVVSRRWSRELPVVVLENAELEDVALEDAEREGTGAGAIRDLVWPSGWRPADLFRQPITARDTTTRRGALRDGAGPLMDSPWLTLPGRAESATTRMLRLTVPQSYGSAYDDLFAAVSEEQWLRRSARARRDVVARVVPSGSRWIEKRLDEIVLVENITANTAATETAAAAGDTTTATAGDTAALKVQSRVVARAAHRFTYPAPAGWGVESAEGLRRRVHFPATTIEAALFYDEVAAAIVAAEGRLFSVEGAPIEGATTAATPASTAVTNPASSPAPASPPAKEATSGVKKSWVRTSTRWLPPRARENQLVAYDEQTLQVLWRRTAGEEELARGDVSFVGVPVASGDLLLAPILDGSQLYLLAMDARSGSTRWRSLLSEEPREGWQGAAVWTPIRLVVAGRELYVSTGSGAVVAMDAATGAVRWRSRYERQLSSSSSLHALVATDDVLVFTAPDLPYLVGLERLTGRCRWVTPLPGEIQDLKMNAGWLLVLRGRTDEHQETSQRSRVLAVYQPSTGRRMPLPVNVAPVNVAPVNVAPAAVVTTTPRPLDRWLESFTRDRNTAPLVPTDTPAPKSSPAPLPAITPLPPDAATWRLLVSDAAQDRLLELDPRGQVVATKAGIAGPGPCCVGSDSSRWVVSHGELSLWQYSPGSDRPHIYSLPARPASVDALSDGGLLLTFPACRLVAEWQPERGWGWGTRLSGSPVDAQRLAGGRTRITLIDDRRVVDVDERGQQVWESGDLAQPRFGRRLPSGRTLIVGWSGSGVLGEWDESGREMVWSRIAPQPVFAAVRLPHQQLAVADATGLQLLSSTGQTLWKMDGLLVTGLSVMGE